MLIQEQINDTLVKTYSDKGMYIHGGCPEADYEEAIDPIDANRIYTETDILITHDEQNLPDDAEYAMAGRILMGAMP